MTLAKAYLDADEALRRLRNQVEQPIGILCSHGMCASEDVCAAKTRRALAVGEIAITGAAGNDRSRTGRSTEKRSVR